MTSSLKPGSVVFWNIIWVQKNLLSRSERLDGEIAEHWPTQKNPNPEERTKDQGPSKGHLLS